MDDYPDSDEEFELIYGDFNEDFSLLRQLNRDLDDSLSVDSINVSDLDDDGYPDSDEEFEIRYNSELEVLDENHADVDVSKYDDLLDGMLQHLSFGNSNTMTSRNEVEKGANNNEAEFIDKENAGEERSSDAVQEPTVSSSLKRRHENVEEHQNAKRIYRTPS